MMSRYDSSVRFESAVMPGVELWVDRMSFGRRIELMRAIRDVSIKVDFHQGGSEPDKMNVGLIAAEVDRIYVRWGLRQIEGLLIDGEPATPETLTTKGPEAVFAEALARVKQVCCLSDAEKKT